MKTTTTHPLKAEIILLQKIKGGNNMSLLVLDISKYNPIQDYKKAASAVDGVIIRCGYRGMSTGKLTEDPMFAVHVQIFKAAGTKIGVYFFTTAINENEGAEEAAFVYSLIQKYNIDISFPVFIDSEMSNKDHSGRSDKLSKSERTIAVDAFCKKIQLLGYTAGIYASDSWFNSMLDSNMWKQYKLWVAKYSSSTPKYVHNYTGWQYTSNGSIPGINKRVDLSYWYESIGSSNNKANTANNNPYLQPTSSLKRGSKGQGVYWLQYELSKIGYNISVDGDFGPNTEVAVKDYQKSRGLKVDGIVGSITRNALINKLPNKVKPVKEDTNISTTDKFATGSKITLDNTSLYSSSASNSPKRNNISGDYYIWSSDIKNNKIRICKDPKDKGNIIKVVGWVDISEIK
jgi:GH25 family lysozyme M1 (1,4-beta-N-acetylmuramidase)